MRNLRLPHTGTPPVTAIAPHPQEQHPLFRAAIALLGVLAVAGVIGLLAELLDSPSSDTSATALLSVDGVDYEFTPTNCFVSDQQFATAGNGFVRGQRFWVSASNINLDLSVGTEHALDDPAPGFPWLMSVDEIDWSADGQTVVAEAVMVDRHLGDAEPFVGSFELDCADGAPAADDANT